MKNFCGQCSAILSGGDNQTNSFSPRRNWFAHSDRSLRQVCSPNLGQQ
jgi:hypothetical protein